MDWVRICLLIGYVCNAFPITRLLDGPIIRLLAGPILRPLFVYVCNGFPSIRLLAGPIIRLLFVYVRPVLQLFVYLPGQLFAY